MTRQQIQRTLLLLLVAIGGWLLSGTTVAAQAISTHQSPKASVVEITEADFRRLIYDPAEEGNEWKYKGDKPAIVDFYAVWCGPCKVLKPRLEEIARHYGDQIVVYSINAEDAPRLSIVMGVQAYPTLFFIPRQGIPTKSVGLLSVKDLKRGVDEILLNQSK